MNKTLRNNKHSWHLVLILVAFSVLPNIVNAQEVMPRIGISPHTFELEVLPGQITEETIKIINQSNAPLPMTIKVVSFTAEDDTGQMIFEEASQDISINPSLWFKIEKPDFILDPDEVERIKVQINVPENAERRGHYAVLIFKPTLPSFYFKEEALVKNIPEIGALFLLSVKKFTLEPEIGQRLEIAEFSLTEDRRMVFLENLISRAIAAVSQFNVKVNVIESSPVKIILRIKNNDVYHIRPYGEVIIYNIFGSKVGETEISKQTILPGKSRLFPVEFNPEVPEKLNWLPASVSEFLVRNFFIGKYEARIDLEAKTALGAEIIQPDITTVLVFFSFPWKFWLFVFVTLSLSIFFFRRYKERIKVFFKVLLTKKQK